MKKEILIIDYKVGNHQSVENALTFLGYDFLVSDKKEDIRRANVLILPGVGAFGEAMANLKQLGILETLSKEVLVKKKPILGICLGMQIMADYSEENGRHEGLGFIEGGFVKLEAKNGLRVPHVGWNNMKIIKKAPLFSNSVLSGRSIPSNRAPIRPGPNSTESGAPVETTGSPTLRPAKRQSQGYFLLTVYIMD